MDSLEVGKKYPGNYSQEGIKLDYNGGFTLYIMLPDLNGEEIKDIKSGSYRFGLTVIENILFFISEFGNSINLSDAPFHFGLYIDNRVKELPRELLEGQGIGLNIIAIDSYTGIVKVLRLIGLPTDFSRELIKICIRQSNLRVDSSQYNRKFSRIQSAYSSENLYNESAFKCSGGE